MDLPPLLEKYLLLAYNFHGSKREDGQGVINPEDEEFAMTDQELLQKMSRDVQSTEQVQDAVNECQMCLYSRDVGVWHQEFWSRFLQDGSLELANVLSSSTLIPNQKLELSYDKKLGEAASVFTSALVLCNMLGDPTSFIHPFLSSNKKIIELGSGTGVFGLAAALLGGNVIMTDREMVIPQITNNIERNLSQKSVQIQTQVLEWGTEAIEKGDLIVCSDCIYHAHLYDALIETMKSLCHSETVIALSFEMRKKENEDRFMSLAAQVFGSIQEISQDINQEVRVFQMKL